MLYLTRRLLPAPLHRVAFQLAHAARTLWWRVARPRVEGCRIVALDAEDRVLLVRHSYGSGKWMLPGGGMGRGESAVAAAERELREETGCELRGASLISRRLELLYGARNSVNIVAGRSEGVLKVDGREIVDAAFFALDRLPSHMSRPLPPMLPAWVKAAKAARPADPDGCPDR